MKGSFRQSMTWLHTWTGLVVGWVLFFVFVTGTASYAAQEITRWMQPERPLKAQQQPQAAEQFSKAYQQLKQQAGSAEAQSWSVNLVSDARTGQQLSASWTLPPEPGERRGKTETLYLDPASGEPLQLTGEPRETAGGRAFVRMHYALHYLPTDSAILFVGLCTMLMFVAIITGVIAHKRIFKDFYTFRQNKGLRSWLDAHNLISVSALPFYLMITYSGLLFFLYSYMPLGMPLTYGFDDEDRQSYITELRQQTGTERVLGLGGGGGGGQQQGNNAGRQQNNSGAQQQGRSAQAPEGGREDRANRDNAEPGTNRNAAAGRSAEAPQRERGSRAAQLTLAQQSEHFTDISALVAAAEQQWGEGQVRSVNLTPAARGQQARVVIAPAYSETIRRSRGFGSLSYDAVTGKALDATAFSTAAPEVFGSSMLGLHEGLFAGSWLRWLYLISGILGCAMIATGLVLWTVKRRPKLEKTGDYATGHQLVEKLNLATIAGLSFGMAAYFWANRLLPTEMAGRAQWEIHCLFLAWAALAVFSLCRPVMQGWRDSLLLAALAFLLLPLLNAFTTERHLLQSVAHQDWALASVDLVFLLLGALLAYGAYKVQLKQQKVQTKAARPAAPTRKEAADAVPAEVN